MFSKSLLLVLAATLTTQGAFAAPYEIKSKTSSSYILVREAQPNTFEILYCQQGAAKCVALGNKKTYTAEELQSLKTSEYTKAGLTGAGAVATVLAGAWLGAIGGGILGLKYLAGATAINAAAGLGAMSGFAITSTGVSLIDRMNPYKHYKAAKMVSKMGTAETDYVNNVDSQAKWLSSRLNTIH